MKTFFVAAGTFSCTPRACTRTGIFEEAEQAFIAVTKENDFYQQSLYRLAELARQKGNEKKALSFFEKIVETEKNSLWKQYAERELQFAKAAARN